MILGRDCPRTADHGAHRRQVRRQGRGIIGGDPRLRGAAAVYAAKARRGTLDGEHGVIRWGDSEIPPLLHVSLRMIPVPANRRRVQSQQSGAHRWPLTAVSNVASPAPPTEQTAANSPAYTWHGVASGLMIDVGCGIASCLLLCHPMSGAQSACLKRVAQGSPAGSNNASAPRPHMRLAYITEPTPTVRAVITTAALAIPPIAPIS